jgi:protein SCO1/2
MRSSRARAVLVTGVLVAVAVVAAAVATLTRADGRSEKYRGSRPPSGIDLPNFALRSYTGRMVRRSELSGKAVVVTFLETECEEACPIIAGEIARAAGRLPTPAVKRTAFIAISTHPRDDRPASVRHFLATHHALGKLDYLVGSEQELRPVWADFAVLSALDSGSANTHSASVRVYDTAGEWVSTLHAGVDLTPESLAHDVITALG